MIRQFWSELGIVTGIMAVVFLGYTLPDWTGLVAELSADAIPLSIMIFVTDYAACLLALVSFRSAAFLGWKRGQTAVPHLVLTLVSILALAIAIVTVIDDWDFRIENGRKRLELLALQSAERTLPERTIIHARGLALDTGRLVSPGIYAGATAFFDRRLHAGGRLASETWSLSNCLVLTTNVRSATLVALPGRLGDLLRTEKATFVSSRFDRTIASFCKWPAKRAGARQIDWIEGCLFVGGLMLLATGIGFLCSTGSTQPLTRRLGSYFVFILAIGLPAWLASLWWTSRIGPSDSILLLRGAGFACLGIIALIFGLRHRRRLETRSSR